MTFILDTILVEINKYVIFFFLQIKLVLTCGMKSCEQYFLACKRHISNFSYMLGFGQAYIIIFKSVGLTNNNAKSRSRLEAFLLRQIASAILVTGSALSIRIEVSNIYA